MSEKEKELLFHASNEMGLYLSEKQADTFITYMNILLEWNKKINLTAITNREDIILKHFIDSLTLGSYIKDGMSVIDVGTGAGFPGIPLKILYENLNLTLLDSLNKRITFLEDVAINLDLKDVKFFHMRAEEGGKSPLLREKFDVAVSRAVANMSVLAEYCLPFVNIDGKFISMKGSDILEEISTSKDTITKLGGSILEVKTVKIPLTDISHSLIIISKLQHTPPIYPRKTKIISNCSRNR